MLNSCLLYIPDCKSLLCIRQCEAKVANFYKINAYFILADYNIHSFILNIYIAIRYCISKLP